MKELWQLFITFCRIGGLTFGGGYAMLPMLQKEVVEIRKWATEEEIMDYYAVSQCTPGIIAINCATFIGYKLRGIPGAIATTLGVVFPSFVIISIIAVFISNFADIPVVRHAFNGIRVAVAVLILNAIIKLWKTGIKDYIGIILFGIVFISSAFFSVSPIIVVVSAAVLGILIQKVRQPKVRMGGEKK